MANNVKPTNPNEVTHPLQLLDPDAWNNIPICLAKAAKMIVESTIAQDQKMRQMNNTTDTSTRKLTAAIAKNEKDLTKKEQQLKSLIERLEKHLA
jgi:Na+/phosphate symporter